MPNWTTQQYNEYLQSHRIIGARHGPRPIIQELKEPVQEQEDGKVICGNKPNQEKMDGISHKQYRITIEWLISDKRRRDSWGMSETIADCVVSASRRFLGLDDTRTSKRKKSK